MAVARINRGIAAIDLNCERSAIIPVCLATKDEWREYLNSDEQEFRSVFMEWIEGTVYIVEFGTQEQQRFARSFEFVLARPPAFWGYMALRGSAVVPNYPELPGFQTDNSYGPRTVVGTPLPRGVQDYWTWSSLVFERDAQDRVRPLPHLDPVPVVGPHTVVTFDSWELLGLPPGANIPPIENTQFPVPTVDVDLFEALQLARE
ncbi:hypothetical protein PF006_g22785 [Phytophthora fragariae]|uniref:Uncharacterized protein n=1 Tax=Phytophthora fragariae TaxID=53985 RepID=A0A6A3DWQ8_9STRA|nr:hypothetical protein PF009_g24268 [Phytophthora fragariae]KAE9100942.1 hypothetical protein PF006_g22785 [Phytophthora fragariae]